MKKHVIGEFVTYEIATSLRELGFDEECLATTDQTEFIHIKGTRYGVRGAMLYDTVKAPTIRKVFRWFREKYDLDSEIYMQNDIDGKFYSYLILKLEGNIVKYKSEPNPVKYGTYEEAEFGCIDELIKIVKYEKI